MNSKFLNFLFVLACAALIGLGPLRAQNPSSSSDANGSAVTAPAQHPNAGRADLAPSATPNATSTKGPEDGNADSQRLANAAVNNDRDVVPVNKSSLATRFSIGWIGLFGLLGLLALMRRRSARQKRNVGPQLIRRSNPEEHRPNPEEYRRAA